MVIKMGNTHLRPATRENLREYANENGHGSLDDAVVALLAEHRELLVMRRENELLHRMLPHQIDEDIISAVWP